MKQFFIVSIAFFVFNNNLVAQSPQTDFCFSVREKKGPLELHYTLLDSNNVNGYFVIYNGKKKSESHFSGKQNGNLFALFFKETTEIINGVTIQPYFNIGKIAGETICTVKIKKVDGSTTTNTSLIMTKCIE